jgi:threonine dehydratase
MLPICQLPDYCQGPPHPGSIVTISRQRIADTYAVIRPYVRRTPILELDLRDLGLPLAGDHPPVTLKLELHQHAGSFKTRGAFTNLLTRDVPAAGIVAASGGNHGAAVAYAAMRLGHTATIFVPTISSPAKIDRIRSYGATLVVVGDRYADALAESETMADRIGAMRVHAFDQDETLLGQGTVALELEEQAPALDTLLVGVGGGGLIGGIASWHANRPTRVIGVEPETAPTLTRALEAGRPVDAEAGGVAADSLAPARVGERNFAIARDHVDRVVLVTDDAIRAAQRALWRVARLVAEPGGAATIAALASGRYVPAPGERVGVTVSGGNTVAVDFDR